MEPDQLQKAAQGTTAAAMSGEMLAQLGNMSMDTKKTQVAPAKPLIELLEPSSSTEMQADASEVERNIQVISRVNK